MAKKDTKPTKEALDQAQLLQEAWSHYTESDAELQTRIQHTEQGFDEYDNLYRSYIKKDKWPFNTRIFIPLTFSSLFEKGTRLVTGKIKGKLSAGQYGSELGARIGSEVLAAQYDDHDFYYDEPMVSKWLRMDQNTRKYGAAFGLVPWRHERKNGEDLFNGPTFEVLDNRKVRLQPGMASIDEMDYVILEREVTLDFLETVNETAVAKTGKPAYMNLDKLKATKTTTAGNTTQNPSRNQSIRGLSGTSEGFGKYRRFKILTEYRNDIWITWAPDYGGDDDTKGLVLRVIPNPYKHGRKPIVRLVYIPIDDDAYGVSEIEPGRSSQKATNALASGFIEAVSSELYPIIKGHPTNVDWKTIEFKPRAAWIMNNPATDLMRLEGGVTFTRNFVEAFRMLETMFKESMGDTAAMGSNLSSLSGDKTATEIKDLSLQRGARDNLNKLFLAAAITKMYTLWWSMDQQFLTDKKVIKIAGKDAIEYFTKEGLHDYELEPEGYELIKICMEENEGATFEECYESLRIQGILEPFAKPLYPIGPEGKELPKLQLESDGKTGFLSVEPKDLTGQYRWVVDLNTIGTPNQVQEASNIREFMKMVVELSQQLAAQGVQPKYQDLLAAVGEKLNIKNVENYFEQLEQQPMQPGMQPMQQGMPAMEQGMMQNPDQMVGYNTPEQSPVTPQSLLGGFNGTQSIGA